MGAIKYLKYALFGLAYFSLSTFVLKKLDPKRKYGFHWNVYEQIKSYHC